MSQETCLKKHLTETCSNFPCKLEDCQKRHPKLCSFLKNLGKYKFGNKCSYLHKKSDHDLILNEVNKLIEEIRDLKKKMIYCTDCTFTKEHENGENEEDKKISVNVVILLLSPSLA